MLVFVMGARKSCGGLGFGAYMIFLRVGVMWVSRVQDIGFQAVRVWKGFNSVGGASRLLLEGRVLAVLGF